jgi:hypothetical protein
MLRFAFGGDYPSDVTGLAFMYKGNAMNDETAPYVKKGSRIGYKMMLTPPTLPQIGEW